MFVNYFSCILRHKREIETQQSERVSFLEMDISTMFNALDHSLMMSMAGDESMRLDPSAMSAVFSGATAKANEPFPGLSDESKTRRLAVYQPRIIEGFTHSRRWSERKGECSLSEFEPDTALAKQSGGVNGNLLTRQRFEVAAADDVSPSAHYQPNLLDEASKAQTARLWWKRSPPLTDESLQDMPSDLFMEVCYPQQGFYVKDENANFSWNRRFQQIYNMAESADRRVQMKEFVEEFSLAAVPLAKFILSNLTKVSSPLMHHSSGITVELCGLTKMARTLFEDQLRGHKMTNREFWGRNLLLTVGCPQLSIPFSLLVEFLGAKALVYPSVPVKQFGGSDELVYGMEQPELFHEKTFAQSDAEVNSIVQRLGTIIKSKGHWMGSELKYKKFLCGPLDMRVYRSSVDNRIYALGLRRCTASTVLQTAEDYQSNDYFLDVLRPEFVVKSQKADLNADAALHLSVINREKDEEERHEQLQYLHTYLIPQAAEQMSRDTRIANVEWPFFEKGGMTYFLHSWGINMRFLPSIHQKLLRTKLSGLAQSYVEIEMTARALKSWLLSASRRLQDGSIAADDAAGHVLLLLPPMSQDFWDSIVWPMLTKKYPIFASAQKWKFNRLNNEQLLGRFLNHIGAEVYDLRNPTSSSLFTGSSSSSSAPAARSILTSKAILSHPRVQDLAVRFVEKVKCPDYPKAPLEEGLDVHLMVIAKRYLREVACDLKFNPLSNKDKVERYIEFLSQIGERECEEIGGFYAAELERKDRSMQGKPLLQETLSDKTIKYRFKDNQGMRVVDVSREASDVFRLYYGQRVQITLGATAGSLSTIVGVHEGALFKHDDCDDGATEIIGRNAMEVQANYGFVVLDRLIAQMRANQNSNNWLSIADSAAGSSASSGPGQVSAAELHSIMIQHPYHQPNDRTLLIFEASQEVLNLQFGVSHGDRLLFVDGPKRGTVTTVLGTIDGVLWHHPDTELAPEPYRFVDKENTNLLRDPRKIVTYFDGNSFGFAPYPIDAKAVYDPLFQLFAGFRFLVPFGFHFRQVLIFRAGPYSGEKGVVLGASGGILHVLLQHKPVPVPLGSVQAEIVELHSPKVLGLLSYEPTTVAAPRRTVLYPAINGELLQFDTSCSSCLAIGPVSGQRIKITAGNRGGACGIVVGVRNSRLWAHLRGEDGARPISVDNIQVLFGSIFDRDPFSLQPSLFPNRLNIEDPMVIAAPFLTAFGEVVQFDMNPRAATPFGFYHGQQLRMQRRPLTLSNPTPTADVHVVTIVGVALNELWYVANGECFARPIAARSRWELDCMYCPDVIGLGLLAGWKDMFCSRSDAFVLSKHDMLMKDPNVQIVVGEDGENIGVDVRDVSVQKLWHTWCHNMTIIRQDRIMTEVDPVTGAISHRPDGPQAVVVGVCHGHIYLVLRGATRATIATNLPKWLPCEDGRSDLERSKLSELIAMIAPPSIAYEARLGFNKSRDPTMFRWWAYVHCKTKDVILLDTRVHLRLENSRKLASSKSGGILYEEGRKFSTEALTLTEPDPLTGDPLNHELRIERCETIQSYCKAKHNFDIERVLPDLMESILHRIACRMNLRLNRRPRVVVESRKVHTVFCTQEELDILHECCSIVSDAVTNDVERCAASLPISEVREGELRLQALPQMLHAPVLRWVLGCMGLQSISSSTTVRQLCAMLCTMEKLCGKIVDLPTLVEIEAHLRHEMSVMFTDEQCGRTKLMQEEMMWWRRVAPTFAAENCASNNILLAEKAADVAGSMQPATLLEDSANSVQYRFVLSDTTIIRFKPSCMTFQRGDVVEYTFGDVAGIQAVILGMESGRLWRYETSGQHAHFAMPFEGTESEIVQRYGLKKRRWQEVPEEEILKCNPLRYVTYDGTLTQFDTSCDRIFDNHNMLAGERYMVTTSSAGVFPFPVSTVIVILGYHDERLWFILDQTGALPFPRGIKNIAQHYHLQRISSGPVVFPLIDQPGRLVRFMAFLSQEQSQFLGVGGTTYVLFNISQQALAAHGATYLQPLQVTFCDPEKETLRDKKITLIGVRHGQLYIQVEGDAPARRLRCRLGDLGLKSGPLLLSEPPQPVFFPKPRDAAHFRFGTQRGGVGVFDSTADACSTFGLLAGQSVRYSPNPRNIAKAVGNRRATTATGLGKAAAAPPPREAIIIGVRQGSLWRVDKFDKEAKPFIGVTDRSTLLEKLVVEEGAVVNIASQTW